MSDISIFILKVMFFCFLFPTILPPTLFFAVIAGKIDKVYEILMPFSHKETQIGDRPGCPQPVIIDVRYFPAGQRI
jgi:hypothetical protein